MLPKTVQTPYIEPSQATIVATFTYLLLFASGQAMWYLHDWFGGAANNNWWSLAITGSSIIIAYLYCLFLSSHYFKYQFKKLLIFNWRWALFSLLSAILLAAAVHFASQVYFNPHNSSQLQQQALQAIFSAGLVSAALGLLIFVILAPLAEEYLFRGLLFDSFQYKYGVPIATLGSSLIFSSFHLLQYASHWLALIAITLLAFLLAILRHKSQSIIHPIICHAVYNLTIISLGINS